MNYQIIRKAYLLLFFLIGWTFSGNSQVSGYQLEWNGQRVAFSTVSGLDGSVQTPVYRNRTLTTTNTLSTGVTKTITLQKLQCTSDNELYVWFCSFSQTTRQKRDIRVKLINPYGETIKAWRIYQASPLKMDVPPPLNAEANNITIESVVLTCEKIEPDW